MTPEKFVFPAMSDRQKTNKRHRQLFQFFLRQELLQHKTNMGKFKKLVSAFKEALGSEKHILLVGLDSSGKSKRGFSD